MLCKSRGKLIVQNIMVPRKHLQECRCVTRNFAVSISAFPWRRGLLGSGGWQRLLFSHVFRSFLWDWLWKQEMQGGNGLLLCRARCMATGTFGSLSEKLASGLCLYRLDWILRYLVYSVSAVLLMKSVVTLIRMLWCYVGGGRDKGSKGFVYLRPFRMDSICMAPWEPSNGAGPAVHSSTGHSSCGGVSVASSPGQSLALVYPDLFKCYLLRHT